MHSGSSRSAAGSNQDGRRNPRGAKSGTLKTPTAASSPAQPNRQDPGSGTKTLIRPASGEKQPQKEKSAIFELLGSTHNPLVFVGINKCLGEEREGRGEGNQEKEGRGEGNQEKEGRGGGNQDKMASGGGDGGADGKNSSSWERIGSQTLFIINSHFRPTHHLRASFAR